MTTAQFELYHGVVLSQIIRNQKINIKLIERNADHGWGVYEVSDNQEVYRVYVKYTAQIRKSERRRGCGHKACTFTFSEEDIGRIRKIEVNRNLLVCLVCANEEVCTLEWTDVDDLRLVFEKKEASVGVWWELGTSLRVTCRGIELERTVPRNRLKEYNWL